MATSLRLAFNCGRWHPTKDQFITALSMIQKEERKRICDFVFQRDVKTALIGRLLIRKAIRTCLKMKNEHITLGRTEHGRPFLLRDCLSGDFGFDFNISHQGDLVVLACEGSGRVGVDTICLERQVGSPSLERFLQLMRRQLTDGEWKGIHGHNTEKGKLCHFYRIWCMKESYVKAIGIGIGFSLSRLDCCMPEDLLGADVGKPRGKRSEAKLSHPCRQICSDVTTNTGEVMTRAAPEEDGHSGHILRSSFVKVDGLESKDWLFEESLLLGRYIVCVAVEQVAHKGRIDRDPPTFWFVTVDELLEDQVAGSRGFEGEWELYARKDPWPDAPSRERVK